MNETKNEVMNRIGISLTLTFILGILLWWGWKMDPVWALIIGAGMGFGYGLQD